VELHYYLAVIRRRFAVVAMAMLGAAALAVATSPTSLSYAADSTIYVGPRQFLITPGHYATTYDPTLIVARLMQTYSDMIASQPIATEALRRTRVLRTPAQVVARTSVVAIPVPGVANADPGTNPTTQLLDVTVTDPSPTVARDVANALAAAFVDKVQAFNSNAAATEGTPPGLPAYVFQRAHLPTAPVRSPLVGNVMTAIVLALLASCGALLILNYVDLSVRSPEDAERSLGLPVLGVIPVGTPSPAG
jgi:capsular polysaccharide biosynthesis protein